MTRILIVDDQRLFAESLRTVLEGTQDDFRVCALAGDGAQAVAAVAEHQPDIVLMDVSMPAMDGVEAARIIHNRYPELPILMLTTFEDDGYVREAIAYGARGYLLKNIPSRELVASIRAVLSGAMLLDPRVVGALVGKGRDGPASGARAASPEWFDSLSRRERQILGLIVDGLQNDEIAQRLCVAPQTVRNYVSRLYDKTATGDRLRLIRLARASGLF
ncbi:MAG TPA: response regulator transcription factor [Spirochaetales bacterium]|nr:response regulator transcription factor [Spirochaetales bacterium]HPG85869.1 response regulator transcription factor [Spirochaetales bacterium]